LKVGLIEGKKTGQGAEGRIANFQVVSGISPVGTGEEPSLIAMSSVSTGPGCTIREGKEEEG
jgi:hypothetical protein